MGQTWYRKGARGCCKTERSDPKFCSSVSSGLRHSPQSSCDTNNWRWRPSGQPPCRAMWSDLETYHFLRWGRGWRPYIVPRSDSASTLPLYQRRRFNFELRPLANEPEASTENSSSSIGECRATITCSDFLCYELLLPVRSCQFLQLQLQWRQPSRAGRTRQMLHQ